MDPSFFFFEKFGYRPTTGIFTWGPKDRFLGKYVMLKCEHCLTISVLASGPCLNQAYNGSRKMALKERFLLTMLTS